MVDKKHLVKNKKRVVSYSDKVFHENLVISDDDTVEEIFIEKCTFHKIVQIKNCKNLQVIFVSYCEFASGSLFNMSDVNCNTLNFLECNFDWKHWGKMYVFSIEHSNIDYISFTSCDVGGGMNIENCSLNEATFSKLGASILTLKNCKLEGSCLVNNSYSMLSVDISKCSIYSDFEIKECELDALTFTSGTLRSDGSISLSDCDVVLFKTISYSVQGLINLNGSNYYNVVIADCAISGYLYLNVESVRNKLDSITANYLKHESIKRNDFITARELHKLEMNAKLSSVSKEIEDRVLNFCKMDELIRSRINALKSLCVQYGILLLNKASNNQGTNWLRGVRFVLLGAAFFTVIIQVILWCKGIVVFDLSQDGISYFGHAFLDVLNIFRYSEKVNDITLPFWGRVFHLLSRIFIAYGVYQTVSAFRSYGKKQDN